MQNEAPEGIQRSSDNLQGVQFENITFEGYGPGGVALLIEALTDNRNRTVATIRLLLSKGGGSLGETGCVGWMFEKRGFIAIKRSDKDKTVIENAVQRGATKIVEEEGLILIETTHNDFEEILESITKIGVNVSDSFIDTIASDMIEIDNETAEKVDALIERLKEDEDIQNVYTNVK